MWTTATTFWAGRPGGIGAKHAFETGDIVDVMDGKQELIRREGRKRTHELVLVTTVIFKEKIDDAKPRRLDLCPACMDSLVELMGGTLLRQET